MNKQYMCIKGYDNDKHIELFEQLLIGKIYDYDFLVYNRYIIDGLLLQDYIIPLEEWREQQINKILYGE